MGTQKVGYGAGTEYIEVNKQTFSDIETEAKEVLDMLLDIQEILYKHLKNITEMQSKYLDEFCEESEIVTNELENIHEVILNFIASNNEICGNFNEVDQKLGISLQ